MKDQGDKKYEALAGTYISNIYLPTERYGGHFFMRNHDKKTYFFSRLPGERNTKPRFALNFLDLTTVKTLIAD